MNSFSSSKVDTTLSTLAAMRHQEDRGYLVSDCLYQSEPAQAVANRPLHEVDVDCRNKMTAWCYQVVDFCKFSRETVEISMNYLDRYMMSSAGHVARADRKLFQLAAMTSLYTAVKIHEPEAMDPKLVSSLSRGTYTVQQVEEMEANLLGALQWRLNPPTSLSFARMFLELIPEDVLDQATRDTAYDITKYQTELAVSEIDFVSTKASTVAFCALMNSLESVNTEPKVLAYISFMLSEAIGIDSNDDAVLTVQNCLYQAVVRQPDATGVFVSQPTAAQTKQASLLSSFDVSPRCISATR